MLSMTGFGKAEITVGGNYRMTAEISSVNRKQLEVRLTLPPELAGFEAVARRIVAGKFNRGAVQLRMTLAQDENSGGVPTVDRALLNGLIREVKAARIENGLSAEVSVESLLLIPGVVKKTLPGLDSPEFSTALESVVTGAADGCRTMRSAEGDNLRRDFLERLAKLEKLLAKIESLTAGLSEAIRERLLAKLREENIPVELGDDRLLKEVLFYADRADVAEEITRLHSHFDQMRKLLDSTAPVGRNLDFLMQEFFREITTLGNKTGSVEVSPFVVEFKSELEKMREQIQNVE